MNDRLLQPAMFRPRIYYLNPLSLTDLNDWREAFDHAEALGFDTILSAPLSVHGIRDNPWSDENSNRTDGAFGLSGRIVDAAATLVDLAAERSLRVMLDVAVQSANRRTPLDPRLSPTEPDPLSIPQESAERDRVIDAWETRIGTLAAIGVSGFRCLGLDLLSAEEWRRIIARVKTDHARTRFLAFTPGTDFAMRAALEGSGFDASFSSIAWWNFRDGWFANEYRLQQRLGNQIAFPEAPFSSRLARGTDSREIVERRSVRALALAAWLGDGLLVPMGFEYGATLPLDPVHRDGLGLRQLRADCAFDISAELRAANETVKAIEVRHPAGLWVNADAAGSATVLARSDHPDLRRAQRADVILVNRDLRRATNMPRQAMREIASPFLPMESEERLMLLRPGEVRAITVRNLIRS